MDMRDKILGMVPGKAPVPYPTGKKTLEELTATLNDLYEEEKRFTLEAFVEEEAKRIRDIQLKRLEEVVTLDEILEAFMNNNLCRRISVWLNQKL